MTFEYFCYDLYKSVWRFYGLNGLMGGLGGRGVGYLINPIFESATEGCVEFERNVVQKNLSFRTPNPATAAWPFSMYLIDGVINTRTIDLKKIFIVLWKVSPTTLSLILGSYFLNYHSRFIVKCWDEIKVYFQSIRSCI